jgi:hypothetical protein
VSSFVEYNKQNELCYLNTLDPKEECMLSTHIGLLCMTERKLQNTQHIEHTVSDSPSKQVPLTPIENNLD